MSNQKHQTIQVVPVHGSMLSILKKFEKLEKPPSACRCIRDMVLQESYVSDFGVRFKVCLIQSTRGTRAVVSVAIPGWKNVRDCALRRLQELYGNSITLLDEKKATESFDFLIYYDEATKNFDSPDECATSLAQIRVQVIGAPIHRALARIISNTGGYVGVQDTICQLAVYPKCGTCYCLSTQDKVMVIFIVDFEDGTERALARLFLQQFAGAQKQVSQSPHCEFRRANEPPKEIMHLVQGSSLSNCYSLVGYISFTFFPSHVKSLDRQLRAVELMVNFFPYLDRHVKSTKSYMHARLRAKRHDLLKELVESNSEKGTMNRAVVTKKDS